MPITHTNAKGQIFSLHQGAVSANLLYGFGRFNL
jgi:hypothetical protein